MVKTLKASSTEARPTAVIEAACCRPMRMLEIIVASSSWAAPITRTTTRPPVAVRTSASNCLRALCHTEPSGAGEARRMVVWAPATLAAHSTAATAIDRREMNVIRILRLLISEIPRGTGPCGTGRATANRGAVRAGARPR